ncbi:hypothetical protein M3661_19795 [Paenibacillus sp. MER 180]|uniref:hypothetical protein n=1 Tax=Paenibacillus sp. MER 180 TaxID=2939570 RepID=UPI002041C165|nr:hypothetical protein [Paenibacillus sp. MER 180]MCM3292367.1 hypothetical protein [Paenibacillus sp. MER 180]
MDRKILAAEALAAGRAAKHNLKVIQENPEKIRPGKMENAEAYLNMMINFAEEEIKNARRAGRTSLRTWLKCLVLSIVTSEKQKRKEGAA